MTGKIITSAAPLKGKANIPGDKSISHRMLIFAMLGEGTSLIRGLSNGDDVNRTKLAIQQLGIEVKDETDKSVLQAGTPKDECLRVYGGLSNITEPENPLDMGNSGTGLRLLAGVLSRFDFLSILTGDQSIRKRPMARIVEPLSEMGATIEGRRNSTLAPLVIRGGNLKAISYSPPIPSAQVKSAVILAGMGATGSTKVFEKIATRRHTEEMCAALGLPVKLESSGSSLEVTIEACTVPPFEMDVAKDPSQAAFVVVAALIIEGSEVEIENVYLGPGRDGFIKVLIAMGADINVSYRENHAADILVRHSNLSGTFVSGQLLADAIDEVPILAVAAAYALGETRFIDASELRAKESDRLVATQEGLANLGVDAKLDGDSLVINGKGVVPKKLLTGETIQCRSYHDHRIAMAFSVATMASCNETKIKNSSKNYGTSQLEIDDFDAVDTSWPGFLEAIKDLEHHR